MQSISLHGDGISFLRRAMSAADGAGYAGDLSAHDAFAMLKDNSQAVLVDVRSSAEWSFVGLPDLSALNRKPFLVEWQAFPGMSQNPRFVDELRHALAENGVSADSPILFLCRSGARSRAAAMALTQAGFSACYNIAGGFEGDLDEMRHRGRRNGWKASGLPWVQG